MRSPAQCSGKSTLLQAIGGAIGMSEGQPIMRRSPRPGLSSYLPRRPLSRTGRRNDRPGVPPLSSILQTPDPVCSIETIIDRVGLGSAAHKQIRYYSSGMKQRVKLAQAIFSDTPVLLLDEPCTNLDSEGIGLYRQLIKDHAGDRLVIVSSNDLQEYDFCEQTMNIWIGNKKMYLFLLQEYL